MPENTTTSRIETTTSLPMVSRRIVLKILVDNYENPENPACFTGWGLSILVQVEGTKILFDTGPDPDLLLHNAKVMGEDLRDIDIVVISHEHGDHVGGIEAVIMSNRSVLIYIPKHMSSYVKSELYSLTTNIREVESTTEIMKGVYIVGELFGPPYEQALAVALNETHVVLIVGCSHPGVDRFVEKVLHDLGKKVYLVIGGFHTAGRSTSYLKSLIERLISLNVSKIAPIHCSGDTIRKLLAKYYPQHYLEAYVCKTIELGS